MERITSNINKRHPKKTKDLGNITDMLRAEKEHQEAEEENELPEKITFAAIISDRSG